MKPLKLLLLSTLFGLFFTNISLTAQETKTSVSGIVMDGTSKEPLLGATVVIPGTTKGAITNEKGAFTINNVQPNADLNIESSYLGYKTKAITIKTKRGVNTIPEKIIMEPDNIVVDDVVVTGKAPQAIQKGDTTQYNAGAYKANPDATAEDLLNKMPGFESTNGSVTVGGETITQVYVDGKSYFKDDVTAALNSLPAGAIESIQLYDEKSDNTRFTGVDDGDRSKTINIVTKAKKKNAYFGDYIAGGGFGLVDNKGSQFASRDGMLYTVKANTNIFQDNNRFTIGIGSNNINQASIDGNRFYGGSGRSGLSQSTGVRFNYSGDFKKSETKKTTLGANYRYGNEKNELVTLLEQLYPASELQATRNYTELLNRDRTSNTHSMRLDLESDVNENNKIFLRAWGSIRDNNTLQNTDAQTVLDNVLTNKALTKNKNTTDSYSLGANLSWMHKFTPKHSITAQGQYRLSDSNGDQFLTGTTESLQGGEFVNSIMNQKTLNISDDNTVGLRLTYTYKLSEKSGLTANYNGTYNWSNSDKKTYLFDEETGTYITIDEALSNVFNRDYFTNSGGIGYSYNVADKITFSASADYQNASLENNQTFPTSKIFTRDYNFESPLGNIRLDYYFNKNSRLGVFYNGRPELPTVNQLQDVVDNTNPLKVSTGNPNLNQSYNNMLGMHYFFSNPEKSTNLRAYMFFNNYLNTITTNTRFLTDDEYINGVLVQKGAQVSSPTNTGGKWTLRTGLNYAFPLTKIKSNFSVGAGYNYSRLPSIYNDVKALSKENGGRVSLQLTSNISSDLDFTLSSRTNITYAKNSANNVENNTYLRENLGAKVNWIFFKGFFVNVDYSYNYNFYSANGPTDPNFHLLNAGIGKKFLKAQNMEVRLSGFDLLNQSKSLSHTVYANYIEDSRSNVLQRYLMLTLSYKFNTMKGKGTSQTSENSSHYPGGGSPMGGGGSMGGGRRPF